jgi:hypothetical protein
MESFTLATNLTTDGLCDRSNSPPASRRRSRHRPSVRRMRAVPGDCRPGHARASRPAWNVDGSAVALRSRTRRAVHVPAASPGGWRNRSGPDVPRQSNAACCHAGRHRRHSNARASRLRSRNHGAAKSAGIRRARHHRASDNSVVSVAPRSRRRISPHSLNQRNRSAG